MKGIKIMKPFSSFWDYTEPKLLTKCPICGEELEVNYLYQYSQVHRVLKSGKISKKRKINRCEGSMECWFLSCSKCDFCTDCDLDDNEHNIHIWQDDDEKLLYVISTEKV